MRTGTLALPIPERLQASLPAATALTVQGLSSLSNLIVTWYLVRRIGVDGFGYFTIYFMVAVNVTSIAAALISQPLYSIASQLSERRQKEFVQSAAFGQNLVNLGLTLLGGVGMLVCYLLDVSVSHAFAMTALSVGMNFGECWRRNNFFGQKMLQVLAYDLLRYAILALAMIGLARAFSDADAAGYAVVMAITYPVAVAAFALRSRPAGRPEFVRRRAFGQLRRLTRSGWHLAIGTLMRLVNTQFAIFVAFFILGAYETGLIRVAQTIVGLLNPALQAIEHIIPTALGRKIREEGHGRAISYFRRVTLAVVAAFLVLYLMVLLASPALLKAMGVPSGTAAVLVVAGICVVYLLNVIATLLAFEARALEEASLVSSSLIWSAALAIVLSYPLVRWFGLAGIIIGISATQVLGIVLLFAKLRPVVIAESRRPLGAERI